MCRLLVTANGPSSLILVTLMMGTLSSSETSVLTRATWRNIPEDAILHSHCRENLKSYFPIKFSSETYFKTWNYKTRKQQKNIHINFRDVQREWECIILSRVYTHCQHNVPQATRYWNSLTETAFKLTVLQRSGSHYLVSSTAWHKDTNKYA
jgi:hypothetical protein